MNKIKSITFDTVAPDRYDERWAADRHDTWSVTGYLVGLDVVVVGSNILANPRCSYMFAGKNSYNTPLWESLEEVSGLELLDTSLAENMMMMFAFTRASELNGIGDWDVSNVKSFAGMFQGNSNCGDVKIQHLDVGSWDTGACENMSHMFYGCSRVSNFPVDNWDVSKVKTFSHMFADCYGLKSIDISSWETLSAESFDAIFNDCRSLTTIDVGGLFTSKCIQFSQMFEACSSLDTIVGLDSFDVSNASVFAFSEMFHGCRSLKEIDLSSWQATPDNAARMFKNCSSLRFIDVSGLDLSNADTYEMFDGCDNSTEIIKQELGK